jgi:NADH-quinone oxidoreductase subunit A
MRTGYAPIVIFLIVVVAFVILSLAVSALLRPRRPSAAKSAPYESGITPVKLPKSERFPVKFYLIAMLFIVFDIEAIFLYPWAVAFRQLGLFGLVEMAVFVGLAFVAYVYIWQKGGLEWEGVETVVGDEAEPVELPPSLERGPGEGDLARVGTREDAVAEAGDR